MSTAPSSGRGNDPIQHVVVLMLENRSFDQMLGILQTVYADLDGIDPSRPRRSNADHEGHRFEQVETRDTVVDPDPPHELTSILRQVEGAGPDPGELAPSYTWPARIARGIRSALRTLCSYVRSPQRALRAAKALGYEGRFVRVYSETFPATTAHQRQQIMAYYPLDFLPSLHRLARDFTVCDHWFSSVPASTWPNRFFAATGTSLGRVSTPHDWRDFRAFHLYDQDTLFDRLNERDVPWRVYHGGLPQTLALARQRERDNRRRYFRMDRFLADAGGDPAAFPAFSFVEPRYGGEGTDDDHPPHDTMRAQALLANVYNALRGNADLWHSTLLVVLYDEHGGFYDHVRPPGAVRPDRHHIEYTFDRLGVRVPALLASPWVKRGVLRRQFDHTSLLKYLSTKWSLGPLGDRVAAAAGFDEAIQATRRPDADMVDFIPPPQPMARAAEEAATQRRPVNENQQGLLALSQYLASETEGAPAAEAERAVMAAAPPPDKFRLAEAQVERFTNQ